MRRNIDAKNRWLSARGLPSHCRPARLLEHPVPQCRYQSVLLRLFYEDNRGDGLSIAGKPAGQSFHSAGPAIDTAVLWLVMQAQFVTFNGLSQARGKAHAFPWIF